VGKYPNRIGVQTSSGLDTFGSESAGSEDKICATKGKRGGAAERAPRLLAVTPDDVGRTRNRVSKPSNPSEMNVGRYQYQARPPEPRAAQRVSGEGEPPTECHPLVLRCRAPVENAAARRGSSIPYRDETYIIRAEQIHEYPDERACRSLDSTYSCVRTQDYRVRASRKRGSSRFAAALRIAASTSYRPSPLGAAKITLQIEVPRSKSVRCGQ
jgi:hypothetical protein